MNKIGRRHVGGGVSKTLVIAVALGLLVVCNIEPVKAQSELIRSISSNQTIISGGIQLLVNGDSFTGQTLYLGIYQKTSLNDTLSLLNRPCTYINSTLMTCLTPRITNPVVTNNTLQTDMTKYTFTTYFTVNGEASNSSNWPLDVYLNPLFKPFVPSTMIFVANQEQTIAIEGVSELHGFSAVDVTVHIGGVGVEKGGGPCDQVVVNMTHVVCRPPAMKPDDITFGTEATFSLTVTISVGSTTSQTLGKLQYTLDEPFSVIMIVMLSVLGFIALVSVFCGILTLCGCQCGENQSTTSVHSDVSYETLDVKPVNAQRSTKDTRGHARSNLTQESTADVMSAGTFRSLEKDVGVDVGVDNRAYESWSAGVGSPPPPIYETIGSEDGYQHITGSKMKGSRYK